MEQAGTSRRQGSRDRAAFQRGQELGPGRAGEISGIISQQTQGLQALSLLLERYRLVEDQGYVRRECGAELAGGGFDFRPAFQGQGEPQPEPEAALRSAGTGGELLEGEFRLTEITEFQPAFGQQIVIV